MRTRKPTRGRVTGVKFAIDGGKEEQDLKKVKKQTLKALEEKEKDNQQWYDQELDKNLKKQ